ncbi:MAG: carboxypeptidase regulatory-like domain-containing protein [Planctomycetaceae bacterium]|nr:carboxypeptidase regulatory-like domain-containing protein [Planctomycetaceae bacterium]
MDVYYGQGPMTRLNRKLLAAILSIALITPHRVMADAPADSAEESTPVVRDVELAEGGVANGVVVNSAGQLGEGVIVTLYTEDQAFEATSDTQGRVQFAGLNGGTYVVKTGETLYGVRMWANGTAPPNALTSFAIVDHQDPVVRANFMSNFRARFPKGMDFLHPFHSLSKKQLIALAIAAGVAAATIAIIFAIEDDGDASN